MYLFLFFSLLNGLYSYVLKKILCKEWINLKNYFPVLLTWLVSDFMLGNGYSWKFGFKDDVINPQLETLLNLYLFYAIICRFISIFSQSIIICSISFVEWNNLNQSCNRSNFFFTGTGTVRNYPDRSDRPVDRHERFLNFWFGSLLQ
jgi:hypothetical protein